jgi:hypothetical protein
MRVRIIFYTDEMLSTYEGIQPKEVLSFYGDRNMTTLEPSSESRYAVVSILKKLTAASFDELCVVSGIGGQTLRSILDSFEHDGLIRIKNKGNPESEVITIRERLFRVPA